MKQTAVIAAALSLAMWSGCSGENMIRPRRRLPPCRWRERAAVSLISVDHPDRFPRFAATQYDRPLRSM